MSLVNLNHEQLSEQIGQPVSEVMVVVAKHRFAGVSVDSLAELIGCSVREIEELEADPIYAEVRGIIGSLGAQMTADQGLIWDSLEAIAGRRLLERVERERDPEFLLRVAATANKMTRRQSVLGQPLEPGLAGKAVVVRLTRRMVERFTEDGARTVAREDRLSIHDGSMQNPEFEEVNQLLGLQPRPIKAPIDPQILRDLGLED